MKKVKEYVVKKWVFATLFICRIHLIICQKYFK